MPEADEDAAVVPVPDSAPARTRVRLPRISPESYRHPLDRQATAALRAVPGFELAARKFSRYALERWLYNEACASTVKVTPKQCGRIHALLVEACDILDIRPLPNLFLSQTPFANAYAIGKEAPSIVLLTGMVELLTEDELMAVIAHELGHIHCGHTVYLLMAYAVKILAERYGSIVPGVGDWLTLGLQAALLEWMRKAEFSCDRAALLVVQDPEVLFSALFKLTGGSPAIYAQMDREEYLKQADEYDNPSAPPLDKFYRVLIEAPQSHPIPVLRAREVLRYGDSPEYRTILAGEYEKRTEKAPKPKSLLCPRCGAESDSAEFGYCNRCGADFPVDENEGDSSGAGA